MKKVTRHPRIVEALIDSEITIKGQRFVEYFSNPGMFYPEDIEKPNNIGAPFQMPGGNDWITSGKVKIVDTVHFKDTKWWNCIKETLIEQQHLLREKSNKINGLINEIDMILFDPITHYSKEMVPDEI